MLEIKAIMNSSLEDILAFKTCCSIRLFDQNLEIHVTNQSQNPVTIPSFFDLKGDSGSYRVDYLMPHGEQLVKPGETMAFYCTMDEDRWNAAREGIFYDHQGNTYPFKIVPTGTEV